MVNFKSLTKEVSLSIQSLFLSNVSISSNVTPFFLLILGRVTVIITGSLHERSRGLSSQLSVKFFFCKDPFCQIYSISQIVYVYQGRVELVWEGVFKIL